MPLDGAPDLLGLGSHHTVRNNRRRYSAPTSTRDSDLSLFPPYQLRADDLIQPIDHLLQFLNGNAPKFLPQTLD